MLINIIHENTLDGAMSAYFIYNYHKDNDYDITLTPAIDKVEKKGDYAYIIGNVKGVDDLIESHDECVLFIPYQKATDQKVIQKETTHAMDVWKHFSSIDNISTPYGLLILDDYHTQQDNYGELTGLSQYQVSAYYKILWGIVSELENVNQMRIVFEHPKAVLKQSDKIIQGIAVQVSENAFPAHFFGKKAVIAESQFRERIMFQYLREEFDFYILYTRIGRDKFKVRLFSDKHDCNLYSKKMGGHNGEFITRNIERLWN